jgi:hypothetical protein
MPAPIHPDPEQRHAPLREPSHSGGSYTSRYAGLEFSWPVGVSVALVIAVAFGSHDGREKLSSALSAFPNVLLWRSHAQAGEPARILVVTLDPRKELTVVATISPRGFDPLLARSLDAVQAIIETDAPVIGLAVVDENCPGAMSITRLLRKSLPATRILVLKRSIQPGEIGPLLLGVL